MRLATFHKDGRLVPGLQRLDGTLVDLEAVLARRGNSVGRVDCGSVLGFIRGGAEGLELLHALDQAAGPAETLKAGAIKLAAPIPCPPKNVFCVGRNYVDHVREGKAEIPTVPHFFTKAPTAVSATGDSVAVDPRVSVKIDYEGELVVVIGRDGKNIPAEQAMDHVFGYTIGNDITARDLQRGHVQWFKGKSLDNSCPLGPVIVTKDEIPDYRRLLISTVVSEEERQREFAGKMIFDIPTIMEHLSRGMTLEAGDMILTGTPAGVGYAMDPPRYLEPGQWVSVTITGIGSLDTWIVAA